MNIAEWLKERFGAKSGEAVSLSQKAIEEAATKFSVNRFAVECVVNLIAATIARCEVKTYIDRKEVRGDEYYSWNFRPNLNQNSTQFMVKLVTKLLMENRVLVVEIGSDRLVADSFTLREKYALREWIFENVTVENFTFDQSFRRSEVMYIELNDSNIRETLETMLGYYSNLLSMAVTKYSRAGGRKGKLTMDRTKMNEKREESLQETVNKMFRNYFTAENAVITMPQGMDYTEISGDGSKKSTSDVADLVSLTKDAFAHAARAYRVPPALISGEIADVDKVTENFLTFCIDPLVDLIENEGNFSIYGKAVLGGNYLSIDTTAIQHIDVFQIAEKIDKLISNGVYSIDELRRKLGEEVIGEPWSQKHYITLNYSEVSALKGGENQNAETDDES